MTEQAFDDQCTSANPRYPLMSEIKQMYLNAYYGRHFVEKKLPYVDNGVVSTDADPSKQALKSKSRKTK